MNEKDIKIIDVLKDNSRMSIRDIGKVTSLRPSTVHKRLKGMVDSGLIDKFTVKLDDSKAGENFIVFMLISTEGKKLTFKEPHIKEVYGITGEYDLLLKMKFSGVEEFNKFIIKFREKYNINKTLTMVGTVKVKG